MQRRVCIVLTAFALTAVVGMALPAQAQLDIGQDIFCYSNRPVYGGDTPKVTGCECALNYTAGWGDCTGGTSCHNTGDCPATCETGPDIVKKRADIKAAFDAHQSMVTVFLHQSCYEKGGGKLWMDEAVRQGKGLRIVAIPDKLTKEEMAEWNKKLHVIQQLIRRQEDAMDKVTTASDNAGK
jgi:hypothetical protein